MSFAFTAAKFLALLRHYSSRPYLTPAQKTVRSLLSAKPEKTFEINEATEIASYKLPHRRVCRIHGCYTNFLKHYEECGLLDVHHRENGYRYFNFDQCSRILEYMRLRNYGVTVREMRSMLMADADEALLLLDEKVKELRKQADRISAVLDEHKRVHAWQQKRTTHQARRLGSSGSRSTLFPSAHDGFELHPRRTHLPTSQNLDELASHR